MKKTKLFILTNDSYFARLMVVNIINNKDFKCLGIFLSKKNRRFKTVFKNLKKTSMYYFFYRVIIQIIFNCFKLNVKGLIKEKSNVLSGEKLEDAESYFQDADFILLVNFDIKISNDLLLKYEKKFINVHASKLPNYSGISPYFWQWVKGEKEIGVTYYFPGKEIDSGCKIHESTFSILKYKSLFELHVNLMKKISKEWAMVIEKAKEIKLYNKEPDMIKFDQSKYYGLPDKPLINKMHKKNKHLIKIKSLIKEIKSEK